ncbi:hypothetical protein B0O99DRAFT_590207 [Bisporella sp. PMI_857]|nr:hypothetical protein B0O99DRAFT_590676 [Bisporella sp. PMI_857]KAH8600549.1 hypothetical protein B0O99DRAFT_590207 [Bisporella sp. PMI_857]
MMAASDKVEKTTITIRGKKYALDSAPQALGEDEEGTFKTRIERLLRQSPHPASPVKQGRLTLGVWIEALSPSAIMGNIQKSLRRLRHLSQVAQPKIDQPGDSLQARISSAKPVRPRAPTPPDLFGRASNNPMVLTHPGEDYVNWAEKVPNRDASTSQVQQWIKEWFSLDQTFAFDIGVDRSPSDKRNSRFTIHVPLGGERLHGLFPSEIMQLLVILNRKLYENIQEKKGGMFPDSTMNSLANDISWALAEYVRKYPRRLKRRSR